MWGCVLSEEMYLCVSLIPSRQPDHQKTVFLLLPNILRTTFEGSQTQSWMNKASSTHCNCLGSSKGTAAPLAF